MLVLFVPWPLLLRQGSEDGVGHADESGEGQEEGEYNAEGEDGGHGDYHHDHDHEYDHNYHAPAHGEQVARERGRACSTWEVGVHPVQASAQFGSHSL